MFGAVSYSRDPVCSIHRGAVSVMKRNWVHWSRSGGTSSLPLVLNRDHSRYYELSWLGCCRNQLSLMPRLHVSRFVLTNPGWKLGNLRCSVRSFHVIYLTHTSGHMVLACLSKHRKPVRKQWQWTKCSLWWPCHPRKDSTLSDESENPEHGARSILIIVQMHQLRWRSKVTGRTNLAHAPKCISSMLMGRPCEWWN